MEGASMTTFPHPIGYVFSAKYHNAPILPAEKYPKGRKVYISDSDTHKLLAVFEVEQSDTVHVSGPIIQIYDPPLDEIPMQDAA
jgi:hypothetical protein